MHDVSVVRAECVCEILVVRDFFQVEFRFFEADESSRFKGEEFTVVFFVKIG